jgi:Flp pilus assembly protein TadG
MAGTPRADSRANSVKSSKRDTVTEGIARPRLLKRFAREEDGSTIIFSLFIFIMMLMIGGMAVDLMNFETRRAKLQATVDSAVLAAADLDQSLTPEDVVRDYFDKSGLDSSLVTVDVQETMGVDDDANQIVISRTVTADLDLQVNTFFMDLIGIDQLATPVSGAANERIQNVEISLVVDISGSMGGRKLQNLKLAAAQFFRQVLDENSGAGVTTISIVPYNMTVVVGDELLSRLNADPEPIAVANPRPFPGALTEYPDDHTHSTCVRFEDEDFISSNVAVDYPLLRAIAPDTELTRISHFRAGSYGMNQPPMWARYCNNDRARILVHETNSTTLTSHVNSMSAGGNTGIDNGMKWAVALLDPALRPVVNDMIDGGVVPAQARNRPFDYGEESSLKIIVLMTDGQNTSQNDLGDEFKNGPSRIWFSQVAADNDALEFPVTDALGNVLTREKERYDGFFVEFPDNDPSQQWLRIHDPADLTDGVFYTTAALPSDIRQLHYIELFDMMAEEDIAALFAGEDPAAESAHDFAVVWTESGTTADERLFGICDAAKQNNDILVYTIAFEAPVRGETAMRNCATAPGYYYEVAGTDIAAAFSSIAGQITQLRLTQ